MLRVQYFYVFLKYNMHFLICVKDATTLDDVNNLFELLGWEILASQRQIERATMVFKSLLQGVAPKFPRRKFLHRESAYSDPLF